MSTIYVVEVIPISRGCGKETLSYYSADKVPLGTVVEVPLRSRLVPALVTSISDAHDARTSIRKAGFEMKKIKSVLRSQLLGNALVESARDAARYYVGTTGGILNTVLPKTILESADKVKGLMPPFPREKKHASEICVLQAADDDRFHEYRAIIRASFGKGQSVLLLVPTRRDAEVLLRILATGIGEYAVLLHGALSKKEILHSWNRAVAEPHPILLIMTGLFLSIPRKDIGTLIVEKEHSSHYKTQSRPFLDLRFFAENYAKHLGARLIFGDTLLRIETIFRKEKEELHEYWKASFQTPPSGAAQIIDMRPYGKTKGGTFALFSKELAATLGEVERERKKIILFAARRGLAPTTLCGDCGALVRCHICNAPVILHKSSKSAESETLRANAKFGNFFLCHNCGKRRDAAERCNSCGGWRLVTLGIGTSHVEEECRRLFPNLPLIRLDLDTAPSGVRAKELVRKFNALSYGVLIGTEVILNHDCKPADYSAIVSLDALFAIPDFRIHEKIFHLILALRALGTKKFLLQTRTSEEGVLRDAVVGNSLNFYRREIALREHFLYPPFSVLVKVTMSGEREKIAKEMIILSKALLPRELIVFPTFITARAKGHTLHGIIKVPRNEWPDDKILEALYSLPFSSVIHINPENVL